jgi:hypothetical protein
LKCRVFNKPSNKNAGVDGYGDAKIDYSQRDITPQIFKEVLDISQQSMVKEHNEFSRQLQMIICFSISQVSQIMELVG